ncbi:hypothetical protein K1719_010160 [Acacia pycnantha]|nr:hypothetical protein K1719_010160 [Acacia pycnantha]
MLLPGQQVTSACVQVFIKCMHEKLVQQGRIEDFGFLCPVYASTTSKELRQEYISKRVCEVPRKVYLFPNWLGNHYQLVIMNMESHYVIFLCSTHSDPSPTLKQIINNGMTTFQRTERLNSLQRGFPVKIHLMMKKWSTYAMCFVNICINWS